MRNHETLQLGRRSLFRAAAIGAAAAFAGPLAPLAAAPAFAAASCNAMVHTDSFGSSGVGTWTEVSYNDTHTPLRPAAQWSDPSLFSPNRYAITDDPAGSSSPAMRFTVPSDGTSYRAEVGRGGFEYGRYRYRVSILIPSDYVPYRFATILSQWHGFPLPDGRSTNPPLSLAVVGAPVPEWHFFVNRLRPDLSIDRTRYVLPVPIAAGTWHDWTIDIVWSTAASPGRVVILHDEVEVLRVEGINNYHQRRAPYFQMGIYRPNWKDGQTPQPDLHIFHRDVSIRDLSACDGVAAPVAQPDTASGDGSGPVVIAPLANDVNAGASTTVDPTSLRLLDPAGRPVAALAVPGEGVWSVDPSTAQVSFAAAAGFAGRATAQRYRASFVAVDGTVQTFGSEMQVAIARAATTDPTGAPTEAPSPTPTDATPTDTPTPTASPSPVATPTDTPTSATAPTATASPVPTATGSPSPTPPVAPTASAAATATPLPAGLDGPTGAGLPGILSSPAVVSPPAAGLPGADAVKRAAGLPATGVDVTGGLFAGAAAIVAGAAVMAAVMRGDAEDAATPDD